MKILFLATYFPTPSSPSRGNWAFEQALALSDAGHAVRVVVPTAWLPRVAGKLSPRVARQADIPHNWEVDGLAIEYPRWPYYPWHAMGRINRVYPSLLIKMGWPFLRRSLDRLVKEENFDFIFAHHTLVSGQIAEVLGRCYGIPYVVTDHEVGDLLECKNNKGQKEVFERVAGGARGMVVVSEAMRREGQISLPDIPFQVVYNGSSFPVLEVARRKKCDGEFRAIFCCAKFYGRKDIPLLLRAFEVLAVSHPLWELRIAGGGPDQALIHEVVEDMEAGDRVKLLGLISPTEVRREMEEADIFALVGWAEPFGVVFLEAMASGLPVVVSSDAGVAEVLEDGVSALFSEPQDLDSVIGALGPLMGDSELRYRIGRAGQSVFEDRFSWDKVITQYENLFHLTGANEAQPTP